MQTISLNCPVLHAFGIMSVWSKLSLSFQVDIPLLSLIVLGSQQGSFILFPSQITILEHKQLTYPQSSRWSPINGTMNKEFFTYFSVEIQYKICLSYDFTILWGSVFSSICFVFKSHCLYTISRRQLSHLLPLTKSSYCCQVFPLSYL